MQAQANATAPQYVVEVSFRFAIDDRDDECFDCPTAEEAAEVAEDHTGIRSALIASDIADDLRSPRGLLRYEGDEGKEVTISRAALAGGRS